MSLPSGCIRCHVDEMSLWSGLTTCSHCGKNGPEGWRGLCRLCVQGLDQHRTQGDWPIVSHLFTYRAEVRELIVQTKSRGGHPEFVGCVRVFLDDPRTKSAAEWCDAVAAAPPSFWTRIRGRPHLATEMAQGVSARHKKAVVRIVPPIFWRFKKQSMKSSESRGSDLMVRFRILLPRSLGGRFHNPCDAEISKPALKVLLVDDVRTTGQTLYSIFGAILEAVPGVNVRSIVLAATNN